MSSMHGYFDITDYASIADAEKACELAGGGVVYFPPGTYPLTTTVEIGLWKNVPVQWRGAGAGVSLIVGAVSGNVQPTMVKVDASVNFVAIQDMGFVGNGYAVVGATNPVAAPMILFNGGRHHSVRNCYFTSPSAQPNTTGICISFAKVVNGEVSGCRFYNFGFVSSLSPNAAVRTDAIYIDNASVAISTHDNHVENGGLGGVNSQQSPTSGPGPGGWCDLSHNFVTNVWGGAVIVHNFDTRAALNDTSYTRTIQSGSGAGSQNIDIGQPIIFALVGNLASYGEGEGIATNGYPSGVLIGNLCWDNVIKTNECGLQFIGQAGHSNFGSAFVGNMCFDDGPGTQPMGLHLFTTSHAYSTFCSLIGNATYGNKNKATGADQGVFQDLVDSNILTRDDSNAIFANNDWPERLHQVGKVPVSPTSPLLLRDVSIPSRYMLTRCGIRITAGGVITGSAAAKLFQLGFAGLASNIFSITVPKDIATWSFVALITNNQDNSGEQAVSGFFCGGAAVLGTFEGALSFDTVVPDRTVQLWVQVDNASDSIRSDYFTIERC